jgi:sec-independent protein translocase protein TatA
MNHLLFMNLGAGEVIVLALVVVLLFGGKKIPELMHGIGKGVKSFKDGMNDIEADLKKELNKVENKEEKKEN